jgi:hypothetical protein
MPANAIANASRHLTSTSICSQAGGDFLLPVTLSPQTRLRSTLTGTRSACSGGMEQVTCGTGDVALGSARLSCAVEGQLAIRDADSMPACICNSASASSRGPRSSILQVQAAGQLPARLSTLRKTTFPVRCPPGSPSSLSRQGLPVRPFPRNSSRARGQAPERRRCFPVAPPCANLGLPTVHEAYLLFYRLKPRCSLVMCTILPLGILAPMTWRAGAHRTSPQSRNTPWTLLEGPLPSACAPCHWLVDSRLGRNTPSSGLHLAQNSRRFCRIRREPRAKARVPKQSAVASRGQRIPRTFR